MYLESKDLKKIGNLGDSDQDFNFEKKFCDKKIFLEEVLFLISFEDDQKTGETKRCRYKWRELTADDFICSFHIFTKLQNKSLRE